MVLHEASECNEMLIDLVCYEIQLRRLSPEMERMFEGHLEHCQYCRHRVHNFQATLAEARSQRNFG
jgi:hypothetical protein